jgi:hypothetical protein
MTFNACDWREHQRLDEGANAFSFLGRQISGKLNKNIQPWPQSERVFDFPQDSV